MMFVPISEIRLTRSGINLQVETAGIEPLPLALSSRLWRRCRSTGKARSDNETDQESAGVDCTRDRCVVVAARHRRGRRQLHDRPIAMALYRPRRYAGRPGGTG